MFSRSYQCKIFLLHTAASLSTYVFPLWRPTNILVSSFWSTSSYIDLKHSRLYYCYSPPIIVRIDVIYLNCTVHTFICIYLSCYASCTHLLPYTLILMNYNTSQLFDVNQFSKRVNCCSPFYEIRLQRIFTDSWLNSGSPTHFDDRTRSKNRYISMLPCFFLRIHVYDSITVLYPISWALCSLIHCPIYPLLIR